MIGGCHHNHSGDLTMHRPWVTAWAPCMGASRRTARGCVPIGTSGDSDAAGLVTGCWEPPHQVTFPCLSSTTRKPRNWESDQRLHWGQKASFMFKRPMTHPHGARATVAKAELSMCLGCREEACVGCVLHDSRVAAGRPVLHTGMPVYLSPALLSTSRNAQLFMSILTL